MSNTFQIPAILDGVSPRKDGSMSLRFVTNEISKDEKVTLMEFYQTFGWLLFKGQQFEEEDVPKETANREKGTKSPSQILRGRLFVYWREVLNGDQNDPTEFDTWYSKELERRGRQYLDRVEAHKQAEDLP